MVESKGSSSMWQVYQTLLVQRQESKSKKKNTIETELKLASAELWLRGHRPLACRTGHRRIAPPHPSRGAETTCRSSGRRRSGQGTVRTLIPTKNCSQSYGNTSTNKSKQLSSRSWKGNSNQRGTIPAVCTLQTLGQWAETCSEVFVCSSTMH